MIRSIPVRDANGDALTLFEYLERQATATRLGARFTRQERKFSLCTGEAAEPLDGATFILVGKSEKLTRIAP
jgi:hypothetical protein